MKLIYPAVSDYFETTADNGHMVNMLLSDIDAYEEKYGKKIVRKNPTILAWMNGRREVT